MLQLRRKDAQCTLGMRNSTGSPIFSDFKSGLSRVVRFRPLVKGNEDAGYEGGPQPSPRRLEKALTRMPVSDVNVCKLAVFVVLSRFCCVLYKGQCYAELVNYLHGVIKATVEGKCLQVVK